MLGKGHWSCLCLGLLLMWGSCWRVSCRCRGVPCLSSWGRGHAVLTGILKPGISLKPSRSQCYPGWTPYRRSCYVFIKDKQTWPSAQTSCQSIGGNLVRIDNKAENDFVWRFVRKHGGVHVWIGMTDLEKEGSFRWIFSHHSAKFVNFRPQEPNNRWGQEHCVHMDGNGKWNDLRCVHGQGMYFVCEAEL